MIIDLLFLDAVEKRLARDRLARRVLERCRAAGVTIVTAESCTGGLVAAALTEIAGSSDVFDRGFVAYANAAKVRQLGVDPALIEEHGAVSAAVAGAMAHGALAASDASLAVSVTGVAGPAGGTPEKPVGLVCFGLAKRGGPVITFTERFGRRSRRHIRARATIAALNLLATA